MLLEEFENVPAVIEPTDRSLISGGEICDTIILSFNGEILERVKQIDGVYEGGYLTNLNSKYPWYIYEVDGFKLAVAMATIGAPMVVGFLEELKARGFNNFIVLGSCGVLDQSIQADKIIIPSSALRDEGASYHYAPASDEIAYDETLLLTMENALNKSGIEHIRTKVWTTDAKVKRRLEAGAKVVDMESSAIMAWAQYRQANVYQFFYTADYVDHHNHEWDARHEERKTDVMTFFEIAVSIALELEK
ncbi:nucleoside phosphorylase [Streptococcus salivarius]|uniref:nucleoside phosphorylase n=1 Tax=Streptococcus salivarius TaxID=1304 RepID=UPI0012BBF444|nr:nucleoside phosphorylase [Streptococcus salivarius]MTQ30042.1 phosphorylase [Streptococcus salivarius]MTQ37788.1 phosphorylase [Streptococcus salivarius]MTQ44452.1 phosphorylase [Streptococcus salivarius]MTQ46068.1 phosphorylase [Streptococcus salivarius]MTQ55680.1 phosphorylase [Streptococcus salivarius]